MPINFDAPVDPIDLTTFVRRVPTPENLVLSNLFPPETREDTQVAFSEITKKNRAARFRAPDGRIHVADRDGGTDRVINMLPLSDSRNQGEYERLRRQMMQLGGTRSEALERATYDDGADLTTYILNRAEIALGDVLTDGIFSPPELAGVEVDYGVPAKHKIRADNWALPDSDGFANLMAACDIYEETNGQRPGFALASRKIQRQMSRQKSLINAVKGAQTGVTRVSMADADQLFLDEGLPTTWHTVETQLDWDGTSTRVIPDDVVILGPADRSSLISFTYGLSATAMELVNSSHVDFSFEDAPGIVGVTVKDGPPFREFTYVDAIGLPLLKDAKRLMVLKVGA